MLARSTVMLIRQADAADAEALARLSGQLGYPADAAAIARRLRGIVAHGAGVVLVAQIDGAVAGWAHVIDLLPASRTNR